MFLKSIFTFRTKRLRMTISYPGMDLFLTQSLLRWGIKLNFILPFFLYVYVYVCFLLFLSMKELHFLCLNDITPFLQNLKAKSKRRIISKSGDCNTQLYRVSRKRRRFIKVSNQSFWPCKKTSYGWAGPQGWNTRWLQKLKT